MSSFYKTQIITTLYTRGERRPTDEDDFGLVDALADQAFDTASDVEGLRVVVQSVLGDAEELSEEEMAAAIVAINSDPAELGLDDEGNDIGVDDDADDVEGD